MGFTRVQPGDDYSHNFGRQQWSIHYTIATSYSEIYNDQQGRKIFWKCNSRVEWLNIWLAEKLGETDGRKTFNLWAKAESTGEKSVLISVQYLSFKTIKLEYFTFFGGLNVLLFD